MYKLKHLLSRLVCMGAIAALTAGASVTAFAEESAAPAATPVPTLEQRVAGLEAYINNTDPAAALKNDKGEIPAGLTTPTVGVPGPGHNAWLMTSSALVLFMTLPGLALFYGGLVRRKNILSVIAQHLGIAGMVTILWWAVGYSLAFGAGNSFIGDFTNAFLNGIDPAKSGAGSKWISDSTWVIFQLTFAIITPALILGAIAERMKFSAVLLFVGLWMFVVYFPLAHMVWSGTGFLNGFNANAGIKAIDFAGGTVVHMSSGWSALILCIILGKRLGFGKENMAPHSMVLCMVGTAILWVGWYGFNAGSALAADSVASNAFLTTTLAAATASFVWAMAEWILRGKPSVLGFCSGVVAGLVVITPAAGFVNSTGAMIIGVCAGIVPFLAVSYLKKLLGYDDALDTFGVHGIGGTMGAILTGILADPSVNSGIKDLTHGLVFEQLKSVAFTLILSVVGTTIIAFVVKALIGLRPSPEVETAGLDISEHGEEGYIL